MKAAPGAPGHGGRSGDARSSFCAVAAWEALETPLNSWMFSRLRRLGFVLPGPVWSRPSPPASHTHEARHAWVRHARGDLTPPPPPTLASVGGQWRVSVGVSSRAGRPARACSPGSAESPGHRPPAGRAPPGPPAGSRGAAGTGRGVPPGPPVDLAGDRSVLS